MQRVRWIGYLTVALTLAVGCGDDSPGTGGTTAVCGNGTVETGETCDDGNGVLTDSCPDGASGSCQPAACGDGFLLDGIEPCDDGPLNSDSAPGACRTDCRLPYCGDGVVDTLEGCDDGNGVLTDGCPDGATGTCELATCGDGFMQTNLETCDDGAANSDVDANACRSDCAPARCGDGVTDLGEACDDGNQDNGDACPDGVDGSCHSAFCGDGFVLTGTEGCDDGVDNSNTTPDACRANCQPASCGDGLLDTGEACDDGGLNSDVTSDACRTTCALPGCGDGVADIADVCDLSVNSRNLYPTRLTQADDGRILVTDPRVHSLFIYTSDLELEGEIKNLSNPLGVAVVGERIYIGCDAVDRVDVFSLAGEHLGSIGEGLIDMPNDLAVDADGNLYVADSRSNIVKVFAADGTFLRDIGVPDDGDATHADDELNFPVALAIAYRNGPTSGELYVADQRHYRVIVFDLAGNFLRTFGEARIYDDDWQGKFVAIQSLHVDDQGRLHADDSQQAIVQILDADTGTYLGHYGQLGEGPGELNLPLDIWITTDNRVVVANNANHLVEVIYVIP